MSDLNPIGGAEPPSSYVERKEKVEGTGLAPAPFKAEPLLPKQTGYPHKEDVRAQNVAHERFTPPKKQQFMDAEPVPLALNETHRFTLGDIFNLATGSQERYKATVNFFHKQILGEVERDRLHKRVLQIKETFEANFHKWLERVQNNL